MANTMPAHFVPSGEYRCAWQCTLAINETFVMSCRVGTMAKSSVAANKYAISLLGLTDKRVARPMEDVTPEEQVKIKTFVEETRRY